MSKKVKLTYNSTDSHFVPGYADNQVVTVSDDLVEQMLKTGCFTLSAQTKSKKSELEAADSSSKTKKESDK